MAAMNMANWPCWITWVLLSVKTMKQLFFLLWIWDSPVELIWSCFSFIVWLGHQVVGTNGYKSLCNRVTETMCACYLRMYVHRLLLTHICTPPATYTYMYTACYLHIYVHRLLLTHICTPPATVTALHFLTLTLHWLPAFPIIYLPQSLPGLVIDIDSMTMSYCSSVIV